MASLGPGAKNFTLDDLAAWIRQLEELCGSKDAALAPASFRTDINGSCLSTFPSSGTKPSTAAQTIKLQTKAVKGYPPLPELLVEKVSSQKKNARGEAKLRLSVERGPALVLLTITDLDGASRTLRAVAEGDNDPIPIKHPATTIEATAIPFTPDQLLERLLLIEAKIKQQREQHIQPSASPQRSVDAGFAQRQADGVEYTIKRIGGLVIEKIVDPHKGTVTMKSSGCSDPFCDGVNCSAAPAAVTMDVKTGEIVYATDGPRMNAFLAPMLKSFQENPGRFCELSKRVDANKKEAGAILEKLRTAKPAEEKHLTEELEDSKSEFANLKDLFLRTAGTGGWLGVANENIGALWEKAKRKDPQRFGAAAGLLRAAAHECNEIKKNFESSSNPMKKKRLDTLLSRKQIEVEEAINELAVIADGRVQDGSKELNGVSNRTNKALELAAGGWFGVPKEEMDVLLVKAMQKDPIGVAPLVSRALAAFDEFTAIEEKLKSASNPTKKKQLSKLWGRKKVEVDGALTEIVVFGGGSEQGGSKELDDVSVRMNEALTLDESP